MSCCRVSCPPKAEPHRGSSASAGATRLADNPNTTRTTAAKLPSFFWHVPGCLPARRGQSRAWSTDSDAAADESGTQRREFGAGSPAVASFRNRAFRRTGRGR